MLLYYLGVGEGEPPGGSQRQIGIGEAQAPRRDRRTLQRCQTGKNLLFSLERSLLRVCQIGAPLFADLSSNRRVNQCVCRQRLQLWH